MSLHAITSSISQTGLLPQVNFGGSPKKKSNAADAAGSDASSIGQIPVGTGQNLLANALQALEQAVGAQAGATAATATGVAGTSGTGGTSAVAAATSAQASVSGATAGSGAATTSPLATDLQGFLHSLFSALRQDSTSAASSATTASTASGTTATAGTTAAAVAATTSSGASQYQGSLVSSLQTLIHQLSGGGTGTQATANLSNSFNSLAHGLSASTAASGTGAAVGGAAATAGGGAATASTSQLTSFLNGLLQKIQSNGSQAPSLLGAHVNANV